jgi:TetR/AcrR family transcriptional repressor of mexJK operon
MAEQTTEPGRSERKRLAILDAAREAFLSKGYGRTSMDEIAAAAAVSKQTVYKNFADKESLFAEIIDRAVTETEQGAEAVVESWSGSADLEAELLDFARRHIVRVLQPHLVRLRRIVIAEAERFPDLARTWYERAPRSAHRSFAAEFAELSARGVLRIEDADLAAEHFNWLILSIPLNRLMFLPDTSFSQAELERYAEEGVRVFLAAYAA